MKHMKDNETSENFFSETEDLIINNLLSDSDIVCIMKNFHTIVRKVILEKQSRSKATSVAESAIIKGDVFLEDGVVIDEQAVIIGPAVILKGTFIGRASLIRGPIIIGSNVLIGNCCEITRSLIMENTYIPHFNIIVDSILGKNVRFGAYTATLAANLNKNKPIKIIYEGNVYEFKTFGSIIGDNCCIGSQVLLQPGVFMGKESVVYPQVCVKAGWYKQRRLIYMHGYYQSICVDSI